jgi:hypothetical protein
MRIRASEVTPLRIYEAIKRRAGAVPHILAWNAVNGVAQRNRERVGHYRDKHKGERCFVIANGPSLSSLDIAPLAKEYTIGMNRIYLLFEKWGFKTTYLAAINELVLEQFADDISELDIPKFLNWNRRGLFTDDNDNTMFLKLGYGVKDKFGFDLTKGISSGGTVTFVSLQLAYYMGFKEVVLVGLDHNFAEKGTPNKTEIRKSERDESHCHPDYFPKGIKWQLPDLYRSELAYAMAREAFEADGRVILDATAGGKCEIFPKIKYEDLF